MREPVVDERELAAELQASKDDATEWGDAAPKDPTAKPAKRRLAAMVSVRLSPAELETVQARAEELGESVSGYLRGLAIRDAKHEVGSGVRTKFYSLSSIEGYLSRVEVPRVTVDGRYLHTYAS